MGGSAPPNTGDTELWNGTNWSEQNNMSQGGNAFGGSGTSASALAAGRNTSPDAATEEWNAPGTITKTLTT